MVTPRAGLFLPCGGLLAMAVGALLLACGGGGATSQPPPPDPVLPSITAPSMVKTGATGLIASVVPQSGITFQWTIAGGTLAGAENAAQVTFTAGDPGVLILSCTASNTNGKSIQAQKEITVQNTAPGSISYEPNPAVYQTGTAITPAVPSRIGGKPDSFSITPPPPQGLSFSTVTGALTGTPTLVAPGTDYLVIASNALGQTQTTLRITVNPPPPTISAQPQNRSIGTRQTATFTITALGTGPLTYQWRRNGLAIAGADGAAYITPAAVLADSGALFDVLVSDAYGGLATSGQAILRVSPERFILSAAQFPNTVYPGGLIPLASGKILVAGTGGTACYLYDPKAQTLVLTGTMAYTRSGSACASLPGGQVLVVGGLGLHYSDDERSGRSAERYDPASGTFSITGPPFFRHTWSVATGLPNNMILITGGSTNDTNLPLQAGEVYDPAVGLFHVTGSMAVPRANFTATLLPNGKVLILGGDTQTTGSGKVTSSVEVFDPATEVFTPSGPLLRFRDQHSAVLLRDGRVLVVGGRAYAEGGDEPFTTEIFDPSTQRSVVGPPLNAARTSASTVLLADGRVLIASGVASTWNQTGTPTAEIFDPNTQTSHFTADLNVGRTARSALLLDSGEVMILGWSALIDIFQTQ